MVPQTRRAIIQAFDALIAATPFEDITKANRNGEGLTEQEDLQLDVFCYGISYMYKNWVLGRYPLSADQAADALFQMMPESVKYYWVTEA